MRITSMLLIATIAILTSCKKNDSSRQTGIFDGTEVNMFAGKAKTSIKLENGVPLQLTISITDAAINSLPTDNTPGYETALSLNAQAAFAPFDHVAIDWNPHGHEPGFYSIPHFDFHFYMITQDEQMSIPVYESDSLKFKNLPAAEYMPANYIAIPGGVPMMGTHWVDVTSPELHGETFTQTFIYGSYNGKVNFYEPMITLDFLKANTNFQRTIPQPASVMQTGYYPTKFEVQKHDALTEVILKDFVYRVKK